MLSPKSLGVTVKTKKNFGEGEQTLHRCCREDFQPLTVQPFLKTDTEGDMTTNTKKTDHFFIEDGLALVVSCRYVLTAH